MALINCPECQKSISDKASSCPHCGCPLHSNVVPSVKPSNFKPGNKKRFAIISALILTVAVVLSLAYYFVIVQPEKILNEQKATYNEALSLLEHGKYDDGIALLHQIPDYEGVNKVLEEAKYESYAYSAVTALRQNLKNPDSLVVYSIQCYETLNAEETVSESPEKKYPVIIMHYGAQNGFGGNTTGYALCHYDEDEKTYVLFLYTDELDVDNLDEDDDEYLFYYISATSINDFLNGGTEIGSIDKARFDIVLKNSAYSAIKLID